MKITKLLLAFTLTAGFISEARSQVVISNFGSSIAATDLTGSWFGNYNSGTSTVAGTAVVGAGSGIQDFDSPFLSILGQTEFSLEASVGGTNPGTSFSITVFDQEGDTAFATFNWASFGASPTVVQSTIVFSPQFDSAPLGWELATGGTGQSINVQFVELSAVPEPATAVLITGALTTALIFRRRRTA